MGIYPWRWFSFCLLPILPYFRITYVLLLNIFPHSRFCKLPSLPFLLFNEFLRKFCTSQGIDPEVLSQLMVNFSEVTALGDPLQQFTPGSYSSNHFVRNSLSFFTALLHRLLWIRKGNNPWNLFQKVSCAFSISCVFSTNTPNSNLRPSRLARWKYNGSGGKWKHGSSTGSKYGSKRRCFCVRTASVLIKLIYHMRIKKTARI